MAEGPAAHGVIARLAAKRLALVREPQISAESVAMIEDAATAIAVLEADRLTHKAARTEREDGAAATAMGSSPPPTTAEIAAELTAQLKRLLTWYLREETRIVHGVPWIRLSEEVFAVLVCSLALVRGTTSLPPDADLKDDVVAEVSQAVADGSEEAVPAAATGAWRLWVRHMCSVAHGHASAHEWPADNDPRMAPTLHRVKVRDHWPDTLKAIVTALEPEPEPAIDIAKRAMRCFVCGNAHPVFRNASGKNKKCPYPPHEFNATLGGDAFLIAYLAEKGRITPTPEVPTGAPGRPPPTRKNGERLRRHVRGSGERAAGGR